MVKLKTKSLKAGREKQLIMIRNPRRLSGDFSADSLWARRFKVIKQKQNQNPTAKNILPVKAVVHIWRRYKEFYRQAKLKSSVPLGVTLPTNVKGLLSKKTITRNMKSTKENLIIKEIYNKVEHPFIKLIEGLKARSSKIIFIYSKWLRDT